MNDCAKKNLSSPLICKAAHATMADARLQHKCKAMFGLKLQMCSTRMQEMSASQLDPVLHGAIITHNKMALHAWPADSLLLMINAG